jgi:hypothetical protein
MGETRIPTVAPNPLELWRLCCCVRAARDCSNMLRRGSQLARARIQAVKHLQTCSPLLSREFCSRGSSAWLASRAVAAAGFDERREQRDGSCRGTLHQQQFMLNHQGNRRRMSTKAVQSGAAADAAQTAALHVRLLCPI